MTAARSAVLLQDADGTFQQAYLYDDILDRHLTDFDGWRRFTEELVASRETARKPEHHHWNWRRKMEATRPFLSYQAFALECRDETQGLMLVKTTASARLASQQGLPLVYVSFLEAAPWNQASLMGTQRYRGVGTVLIAAAVQLSIEEGFGGRIGLHSLPQADGFYEGRCGMTNLGPDANDQASLVYFEMTVEQATGFIADA